MKRIMPPKYRGNIEEALQGEPYDAEMIVTPPKGRSPHHFAAWLTLKYGSQAEVCVDWDGTVAIRLARR